MCFGGGSPRSAAPAPVPKREDVVPPPPPPAATPQEVDPNVRKAKASARRDASLRKGRRHTLLGGMISDEPANVARKTLLGA